VLTFDTESKAIVPIDIQLAPRTSVTGMTLHNADLLVAYTSRGVSELAFVDARSFEVKKKVTLHNVRDVHSIAARDGLLYVVSTGADAVLRYSIEGRDIRFAGTQWSPTLGIGDSVHVNGLTTAGGRLLCSGFGLRTGERWSTARKGFVFDLDANEGIYTGLYHPHSVTVFEDTVFCLESVTGRLVSEARSVWSIDGYARGLYFLGSGMAAIGSSVARQSAAGRFQNSADPGDPTGICGITLIEMANGSRTTISLGDYNNEVYDIVALPE
jgi:hypothetical protein